MDELKSAEEVQEWLTRHEGLCWIAKSSLHLRAFYLVLYSGLGLNETERARRESVLFRMCADTMFSKPADDPFRLTELYSHIETLRRELHWRIETSHRKAIHDRDNAEPDTENAPAAQPTEMLFKPLLDCVQNLDEEWVYQRSLIRRELERAATATPSQALETLDSLERPFRILAVGDHTARRNHE